MSTTIQIRSAAARKAARTRAMLYPPKLTCARCEAWRTSADKYCRACRAAYHRGYRKTARKTSRETCGPGLLCEAT